MDKEEIVDDMLRNDYGDVEINKQLERLRCLFIQKGLPYVELFRSKFYGGSVKYILREHEGRFYISDIDTNEEIKI